MMRDIARDIATFLICLALVATGLVAGKVFNLDLIHCQTERQQ